MDIQETRREQLRRWLTDHSTPPKEKSYFSQLLSGTASFGERAARRLEKDYGMGEGYLDLTDGGVRHIHLTTINRAPKKRHNPGMIGELPAKNGRTLDKSNTEPGPDNKGQYPLISWVQAGTWESIVDNFSPGDAEDWLDSPVKVSGHSFYLRVRGESMYDPADHRSFRDGDIILVDPSAQEENGSFVVVRLDDEAESTFKQLILEGGRKYLKALNPTWPNRIFEVNGNATICGVVKTKIVRY